MRTFDVDADLLRRRSEASVHVAQEIQRHLEAEYADLIDGVLDTLAPNEPYAYTPWPELRPDGTFLQPIATTREGVRQAYERLHSASTVTSMTTMVEIYTEWYGFLHGIGGATLKPSGEPVESDTLLILPVGRGDGITGELIWSRLLPFADDALPGLGAPVDGGQRAVFDSHEQFLSALRKADVAAIEERMVDSVQTSIRDYVADTGTLVALDGKTGLRTYCKGFFSKFELDSIDVIRRVVEDWYAFAELRYKARVRTGPDSGADAEFHTAEFCIFAPDGRIMVRTGHGTDLELT